MPSITIILYDVTINQIFPKLKFVEKIKNQENISYKKTKQKQ